jgi:hypothetical protein
MDSIAALASKMSNAPWWGVLLMVVCLGMLYLAKTLVDKIDPNKMSRDISNAVANIHGTVIGELKTVVELIRKDQLSSNIARAEHSVLLQQLKTDFEGQNDKLEKLHDEMDELRKEVESIRQLSCGKAPECVNRRSTDS